MVGLGTVFKGNKNGVELVKNGFELGKDGVELVKNGLETRRTATFPRLERCKN